MFAIYISVILSLLALSENSRSFVDTASLQGKPGSSTENTAEEVPKYMDDAVKELQNLKNTVGSTLEMMKTHSEMYSNLNGEEKGHSETKEQLNEDGRLVASVGQDVDQVADEEGRPLGRVRTKVDVPSKGIHKTLIHHLPTNERQHVAQQPGKEEEKDPLLESGYRRASEGPELLQYDNNLDKMNQYPGIQYSPLDMAEYVFWTGDEKGVTLAIEEFLQEGLMTREDAISFLQDIKYNLDYLQVHYSQIAVNAKDKGKEKENTPNGVYYNKMQTPSEKTAQFTLSQLDYNQEKQNVDKKNHLDMFPLLTSVQKPRDILLETSRDEDDYGELLDRLRVADFLYTEYSLEEVIYQLAKVMFTQSLTRGSTEAQQALQKFTVFLENEANQGRISRSLEKKVLGKYQTCLGFASNYKPMLSDVLLAALTDTLNFHPELQEQSAESSQSRQEQQNLLKQLIKFTTRNKQGLTANGDDHQNKLGRMQIPLGNALKHLSALDIGKYKNP